MTLVYVIACMICSLYPSKQNFVLEDAIDVDSDYVVTFYPEGGQLLLKTACNVAFKVTTTDGGSENITGKIVDNEGGLIQSIKTLASGIGYFYMYAMPGKTYFLECENEKGLHKRFELPPALGRGYGVKTGREKNRLLVSVAKPDDMPLRDSLYLTVQSDKGLFYDKLWNNTKSYLSFDCEALPSGVIRIVLLDANENVISERLVVNSINALSDTLPKSDLINKMDSFASLSGLDSLFQDTVLDAFLLTQIGNFATLTALGVDSDLWQTINLEEVVVKGFRRNKENRGLYSSSVPSGRVITRKEIEGNHIQDMRVLLFQFSGVSIIKGGVFNDELIYIRGFGATTFQADPIGNYKAPLVVIDDMPYNSYDILLYPTTDIEEIFVLKGADAAVFGPKAQNGIIVIRTKRGMFR